MTRRPAPEARPGLVRVVPELRGAHIERHLRGTPATLLYFTTKYDLDGTPTPPGIVRVGLVRAMLHLLRTPAGCLEVPEPLWLRFWPRALALMASFRLGGVLGRGRRRIGTYAMENNRFDVLLGGRRRAPRALVFLASWLVGLVAAGFLDRICYASPAARDAYASLPLVDRLESTCMLELPAPAPVVDRPVEPGGVVFLGVLEDRKGLRDLMAAWPAVRLTSPTARLTIVGPGPLADDVRTWCAESPGDRTYVGRLAHGDARRLLSTATVLVAPSVPDGRWIEQIGLPIKEALAAGATVVTTRQTGLADWLEAHGHEVVSVEPREGLPRRLASAVARAVDHPLDRDEVRRSLPRVDGRLTADAWLNARSDRPSPPPTLRSRSTPCAQSNPSSAAPSRSSNGSSPTPI